ncbi:hypothetical protein A616_16615 [Brevibacillus brevis X23]|nr:hypothetical protein A616_16615 [Brevibacillus brevis X23]
MYFNKEGLDELKKYYTKLPNGDDVIYNSMKVRHDVLKLISDNRTLREALNKTESETTGFYVKGF